MQDRIESAGLKIQSNLRNLERGHPLMISNFRGEGMGLIKSDLVTKGQHIKFEQGRGRGSNTLPKFGQNAVGEDRTSCLFLSESPAFYLLAISIFL